MASIQIRGDKYSVVYRYTDGGRKKQKWETYRTEKEAKIRKAEIEMQALKGNIMMQSKQTVEAFLCEWMSTYDTNWSPKTKEAYRGFLKNHIAPLIGSKPISTVLPEDIAEMKKELAMRKSIKNEKATLSSTTQKHILKYLHLAFEQAVDWGRVAKNPVTCAMPKRSRSTRGAWEVSEIQKALPSIIDPCLHLAVHIALQCSLRIGEIMAISLDDIDLDRRQVDINRSMQRVCLSDVSEADDEKIFHTFPHAKGSKSALVLKETKTPNSDRSVYFGDSLKKELETRLAVIARQKELLGDEYKNYGLLFADEFGNPVEPNQMGKMFRKWMERESSGIRKICFHELRHTSATIKSIYSADLETVRADTGQTRAVLERVYMHESEAQRRALAERMDAIINNKPVLNKEDKSLLSVVAKLLEQNDVGAALRMILDAKGANVSLGAV